MSSTSASATGTPQSALVGIAVTADLEIIFGTLRSSRKYANLVARAACSFIVGWDGEQTMQPEGHAFQPTGDALRLYQRTYYAVWPEGRARQSWPGIAYLVVRAAWVRYSDYAQDPPLIEEQRRLTKIGASSAMGLKLGATWRNEHLQ